MYTYIFIFKKKYPSYNSNYMDINISIIYNLFANWKNNKDKNIIIDPMACLIKLSILGFYPSGTKISIADNMINIVNDLVVKYEAEGINEN